MPDVITMFQVLSETPLPAIMLVAGCIFLFVAIVGRFAWNIDVDQVWARVLLGLIGTILLLFSISLYAVPSSNGPSETPVVNTPPPTDTSKVVPPPTDTSKVVPPPTDTSDNDPPPANTPDDDPPTLTSLEDELRARNFAGTSITAFFSPETDEEKSYDELTQEFESLTGIEVEVIEASPSATENLNEQIQYLEAGSAEIDVFQIDVIWPGIMARYAVNLNEYVPQSELDRHLPEIIENNTVNGKLVGLPWFVDVGLLYYRTDLLNKYGLNDPPRTWNELEQMAGMIQEGERAEGNNNFWGFVWQGNSYEGLTCNALEWQASHDGGSIISPDGTITVNNPATIAAFEQAAGWVGTISPPEVTSYQEEDAREVWQSGNAAFMRNWPYAYTLGEYDSLSRVSSKFAVTALPAAATGQSAAAIGGWQLMVSRYSTNVEAAALFARYMTSYEAQKIRALDLSYIPTIPGLYSDADLLNAQPVLVQMLDAYKSAVARPSTVTGDYYGQVSSAYFDTVHDILVGAVTASEGVESLEQDLVQITGFPTGSP